jgi:hypothetical protein
MPPDDNFEHVPEGAPLVGELPTASKRLPSSQPAARSCAWQASTMIVPLALPDSRQTMLEQPEPLWVTLFVQRAEREGGFTLTGERREI